ncbi:hypothetical protein SASPL_149398 [Salvia splendens]|uniref:Jasmonate O-methyltransferase n=1 Tax=Salvia splendens TaxID=180675 RepID=A0A8X8WBM5_SALSN|nr:hypothetical protein SASPL_149398 [Salvia splendens]
MHTIIEAIKHKYESSDLKTPEFYVYFNDVVSNDFNTLFSSLPPDRSYKAATIAGDFHGRLLPPSSVHFAYSSWALHWLTKVPKAAEGLESVWHCGDEREEAYDAYLSQLEKDLDSFLKCRAVEMVEGKTKLGKVRDIQHSIPFSHPKGAVHQNMFTLKFGAETADETFDLLKKKLQSSPAFANPLNDRTVFIVAILKHKHV